MGPGNVNLQDLALDYWFDGGDTEIGFQEKSFPENLPFKGTCIQPISCKIFDNTFSLLHISLDMLVASSSEIHSCSHTTS